MANLLIENLIPTTDSIDDDNNLINLFYEREYDLEQKIAEKSFSNYLSNIYDSTLNEMAFASLTESKDIKGSESQIRTPRLEWKTKHHPVLTDHVCLLLNTMWAIVISQAVQNRFPIDSTIISIYTDPIEHEHKALLQLICKTNISQALAFWNSLEQHFQEWLSTLSKYDRNVFLSKISLRVYWQ